MSSPVASIECRYCGKVCTLKVLRTRHGRIAPKCVSLRWEKWLVENQWTGAGAYAEPLARAGLVKHVPLYVWWRIPVDKDGNEVATTRDKAFVKWAEVQMVSFTPVTPIWAKELMLKLSRDMELARKLGFTKKRELVPVMVPDNGPTRKHPKRTTTPKLDHNGRMVKEWRACDLDKQLPVGIRVKIMRVAGNNELAREMIADDPEAAGRIIKDLM